MHTEEEATGKWCPFVRMVTASRHGNDFMSSNGAPAFNRLMIEPAGETAVAKAAYCIGSACMAWRWADGRKKFAVTYKGNPEEVWNWDPRGHKDYDPTNTIVRDLPTPGYCGLAGRPS